jgi:hypothetical protein
MAAMLPARLHHHICAASYGAPCQQMCGPHTKKMVGGYDAWDCCNTAVMGVRQLVVNQLTKLQPVQRQLLAALQVCWPHFETIQSTSVRP